MSNIKQYSLSRNEFVIFHLEWSNLIVRKDQKFWNDVNLKDIIIFTNKYDNNKIAVEIKSINKVENLYDLFNKYHYLKLYPHATSIKECFGYMKTKLNYYTETPIKIMEFKLKKDFI